MDEIRYDFLDSLDLDDSEIIPFIPVILKNLWELGSIGDYVNLLVEKHISSEKLTRVIDLGCGKGAVLIQLSRNYEFEGIGIDLIPDFIEEAKKHSAKYRYSENLKFEVADIKGIEDLHGDFDLVIYAHDSDIFGDVTQSLFELQKYITQQGWIIFEGVYNVGLTSNPENLPNREEFLIQIEKSGFEIISQILWDKEKFKEINRSNTESIREQIVQLIKIHPDKEKMFNAYLNNQIKECKELEEELVCLTLLLKKK